MNGAPTSWARRRAISVLPTPVGPIRMMFFGVTSLRRSGGSCCRRHRLRMATATAFLAAAWPTMYLSSSATIWRGVRSMSNSLRRGGRLFGEEGGVQFGQPRHHGRDVSGGGVPDDL